MKTFPERFSQHSFIKSCWGSIEEIGGFEKVILKNMYYGLIVIALALVGLSIATYLRDAQIGHKKVKCFLGKNCEKVFLPLNKSRTIISDQLSPRRSRDTLQAHTGFESLLV